MALLARGIRIRKGYRLNYAGTAVDAIRCCRVARDRGTRGVLEAASAWLMKAPPTRMSEEEAHQRLEEWLTGTRER